MTAPHSNSLEFGSFRFDPRAGTLTRESEAVPLPPKSVELLGLLLERRGRTVTKREIFDTVWAGTFVEDGVLTQNIYTLRTKLGLDEEGKQFIETVPRRGYRFVGEVREVREAEDVEAERPDGPAEAPARGTMRGRAVLLAVVGLLVVAAAGFGAFWYMAPAGGTAEPEISPIERLRFERLTDTGDVIYPTISPNGELLAVVRLGEEESSVWISQIAAGGSVQVLPPSRRGYMSLAFSPDGSHLFYKEDTDGGPIYRVPVFGGPSKKVAENVWSDFSLSPDGRHLAFVRNDPPRNARLLIVANVDGGEREIGARQPPSEYRGGAPAWSPDGRRLAVLLGSPREPRPMVHSVDAATGEVSEIETPRWREVTRILWTPDGGRLILAARALDEAVSQLWTMELATREARRLTNDLESYFWFSLTADGQTLVARQQRIVSHIHILPDGDLQKARQLTSGERTLDGFVGLDVLPDGRVVFTSRSGHVSDLHSIDPATGSRLQLTAHSGLDNSWPAASPDGSAIAFTSVRTGTRQVWLMAPDGSGQRLLTGGGEQGITAHSAAFSPDGGTVYFIRRGPFPSAIWRAPAGGGDPVQVSRLANASVDAFLSVSPDGRWIAFRYVTARPPAPAHGGEEPPTIGIGVLPLDGDGEPRVFDLPARRPMVQWSHDSTAIDYAAGTFNSSSIWRQPIDGSPARRLLEFPDRIFSFAWSRDGRTLAVSRGRQLGDAVLIRNLPR